MIFTLLLLVPQALNAYDVGSYKEDNDNKNIVQRSEVWQKKYVSLVNNEWCFTALMKWSQSLGKKEKGYVTETLERLKRMVHS